MKKRHNFQQFDSLYFHKCYITWYTISTKLLVWYRDTSLYFHKIWSDYSVLLYSLFMLLNNLQLLIKKKRRHICLSNNFSTLYRTIFVYLPSLGIKHFTTAECLCIQTILSEHFDPLHHLQTVLYVLLVHNSKHHQVWAAFVPASLHIHFSLGTHRVCFMAALLPSSVIYLFVFLL